MVEKETIKLCKTKGHRKNNKKGTRETKEYVKRTMDYTIVLTWAFSLVN